MTDKKLSDKAIPLQRFRLAMCEEFFKRIGYGLVSIKEIENSKLKQLKELPPVTDNPK